MRILFALLVLANVGLWMWATWYDAPAPSAAPPAPRPAIAADKMRLVTEPGVKLIVRPRAPPPAAGGAVQACYRLGPFASLDKAHAAGARLERWGLAYERITEFETHGVAYRLYLPPFPSKEAADRRRREIAALGFTDNALIQGEPGMENAVALGLFSVEQNAQARRQQLAGKGVKAEMQTVPSVHATYWLALASDAPDGRVADVPLARFESQDWGSPEAAFRRTACRAEAPKPAP